VSTPPLRVIALDGPSGSGKSTVARGVARSLGWRYVDTGAIYRAATVAVLRAGIDLDQPTDIAAVVAAADIDLSVDPDEPRVLLGGEDVTAEIRGPSVTVHVSTVSAVPEVRRQLVAVQRSLMGDGAVVEGRDIGTTVAPDAPVKVYLDASPHERARRRAGDADAGVRATADIVEAVAADLARRDRLDRSRTTSPLQAAPDAVRLDSSAMTADEVIARVLDLARDAGLCA
jgi:cytidylate kinase